MKDKESIDFSGRSKLFANVLSGWASHLLTILTGFFVPRIMDAQLGQTVLGIWDFAWSIVAYMSLGNLGLASSLNRFVSNYRANGDFSSLQIATSTSAMMQVGFAIFIALISATIALLLPARAADLGEHLFDAQVVVFVLGLSVSIRFLFETSRNVLNGYHRWDVTNAVFAVTNVTCSLTMIGALLAGYGLVSLSLIYTSFTLVEGAVRFYFMRKLCPESRFRISLFSSKFAGELFRFGITVFLMGIAPVVIVQGTNILIATTLGVQFLAIIARPNSILRFVRTLVTRFTFTLTPMAGPILSREGPKAVKNFTILCSRYGFAFTLPVITMFCFFGDSVIRLWMGDDYVNRSIIWILGLGALLPLAQSPITRILVGLNLHGKIFVKAMLLGIIVFTLGTSTLFNTDVSLERYAMLMVLTLTLMDGVIVPIYACRALALPISQYIVEGFARVTLLWSIPTLLMASFHLYIDRSDFVIVVAECVVYAAAVFSTYWLFLIPDSARRSILRKLRIGA